MHFFKFPEKWKNGKKTHFANFQRTEETMFFCHFSGGTMFFAVFGLLKKVSFFKVFSLFDQNPDFYRRRPKGYS